MTDLTVKVEYADDGDLVRVTLGAEDSYEIRWCMPFESYLEMLKGLESAKTRISKDREKEEGWNGL